MEEVDNIIIHSLRQMDCDIGEEITTLSDFSTEIVIAATIKCLDVIRPGLGLSPLLPANMAARFRLGATLAQACSELGYRGDIGYHTFIYSSTVDLRRLFTFLIDKLPKESDKTLNEPTNSVALLQKSIALMVSRELAAPWLPHYCYKQGWRQPRADVPYRSVELDVPVAGKEEAFRDYYVRYQRAVPNQMRKPSCLLPSLLSHAAKSNCCRGSSLSERIDWLNGQREHRTIVTNSKSNVSATSKSECRSAPPSSPPPPLREAAKGSDQTAIVGSEATQQVERRLADAKSECETLKSSAEEARRRISRLTESLTLTATSRERAEEEVERLRKERRIKERAYGLLEKGGEESAKKLESAISSNKGKMGHLNAQWEQHRAPLIQQYREEEERHRSKTSASEKKLDELRLLREKERQLLEEYRAKDQQYAQLLSKAQKLPKGVNRSAYTQRILEIINNVRKQRDEISKVLGDTRQIQKEINALTGRLERSFTVVDETIFRDARANEASRKAYKLLATLHSDCAELVGLVEQTGAIIREIRDLEEQIDSESAKNVGANLERITADLKQMRQETAALTARLQSNSS